MNGILNWLQTQAAALVPTVKAIIGNSPQPARTTLVSTIILIGIGWLILKIIGAVKK